MDDAPARRGRGRIAKHFTGDCSCVRKPRVDVAGMAHAASDSVEADEPLARKVVDILSLSPKAPFRRPVLIGNIPMLRYSARYPSKSHT